MRRFIYLLIWLLLPAWLSAQTNINAVEYWYDGDYNTADRQTVSPGASVLYADLIDVSSLEPGLHTFTVRFQDTRGVWGSVLTQFFTYYPGSSGTELVNNYEYWFDGDYANSVETPLSQEASIDLNTLLDVSSLNPGLHTFSIRFQDTRGVWGSLLTQFFTYYPGSSPGIQLVSDVEYWFDGDYASAVESPLSGVDVDFNTALDVTSLIDGLHTVAFRFKDSRGVWSAPLIRFFKKEGASGLKELVALEYWYNNDYGNKVSSTFSATSLLSFSEMLDVTAVPIGFNIVSLRIQDEGGRWNTPASWFFNKENNETIPELHQLTAMEYWYDGDYSSVQTDPVSPTSLLEITTGLDVSAMDNGLHRVSSRYRDEAGNWSPVYSKFFTVYPDEAGVNLHEITELQYWYDGDYTSVQTDPVTPTAQLDMNTLLDVSALNDGLHVVNSRFRDETGNWSPVFSNYFSKYPDEVSAEMHNLVSFEYWIDGDHSSAVKSVISPGSDYILNTQLDVSSLSDGLHIITYRFEDEAGVWSSGYSELFSIYEGETATVNNKIIGYRYWADNQIGSAIEVSLTTPVKSLEINEMLDVSALPGGTHYISFQFQDSVGLWSSAYTESYFQDFNPRGTISANSDPTCTQNLVTFTAQTYDVDSIYWDFGDTTAIIGKTAAENAYHAYAYAGTYTITATLLNVDSAYTNTATTSITVNQSYGVSIVAPENLIAYYPLDGDVTDAGTFGHDGTIFEAVPTADRNGNANSAIYFDGVNDYLDIGDWENGGAMSFTFWARWDAFNNYSRIVDLGNGSSNNNVIVGNYQTGDNLFFSVYNNSTEIKYYIQAITIGQWDYFAATIDELGEMKVYKNGSFIGNKINANVPNVLTRTAQYIGRSNFSQDGYFNGAIDELKIYNKALSAEEILLDYEVAGGTGLPPVDIEICSNDLPYSFGTQDLIASGTYYEKFQTVAGCDSIVQLNLTVNSSGSSTQYDTICASELPYTFGSQSITEGGSFIENIPTGEGCDSLVTLHLVVKDTFVISEEVSICETDLPYIFGGTELTASGDYTEVFTSGNGCDSTVMLALTVIDTSLTEVEMSVCESELPLIIGTDTYYTQGVYSKTLNNTLGCDSTVILTLNVLDTSLVTEEIVICESLLPFTFGTRSLSTGGVYTEVFTAANGCDSTVTLTLNVNDTFIVSDAVTVCESELPYLWEGDELTTTGSYTKVLSSSEGCDSTVNLLFTVNDTSLVQQEITLCASDLPYTLGTQTLTGSGIYTEVFSNGNGCDSTVILTLNINDTLLTNLDVSVCELDLPYVFGTRNLVASGTYSDTLTNSSGCDSIVVLALTVNDTFLIDDELTLCESELPYSWEGDELSVAGSYTKTLSAETGCDSTVTLTLTVLDTSLIQEEVTICESELPYALGTQSLAVAGTFTEVFAAENGCDSTVVLTLNVLDTSLISEVVELCEGELPYVLGTQSLTASGTYTEVFTGENGCDSTIILALTVNDTFRISDTLTVCENDLPYEFGTQNLVSDGTYEELFSSSSGCDSTVVLVFAVSDTFSSAFADTVCENDLPYILGSQLIESAGTYTEIFAAENGCDSVVTLTLSVNQSYLTHLYDTVNQSELPYIFGTQSLTKTGDYSEVYTTINGCDSVITMHLLVGDLIPPVAVCHSISIELSADGSYTLTNANLQAISQGSSDDITVAEDLRIQITPTEFTCEDLGDNVVTVRVFDAAGNKATCQTLVHVLDAVSSPAIDAVSDQIIEEDQTLFLDLTGISGGTSCEDWPVMISAIAGNAGLIDSIHIEHEPYSGTATLQIIPLANQFGTDSIYVSVEDSLGNSTSIGFRLTILEVNDNPRILHEVEDLIMVAEDSASITISKIPGDYFEDYDDSSLVFGFTINEMGIPDWVTIFEDDQQLILTFTPSASDTGCFEAVLSIEDQSGADINDTFKVCIDPLEVGISQLEESVFELNLYPNPTRGQVNIDLTNPPPGEIELLVTSINGSTVLRKKFQGSERIVFDLSNNISGSYLVILQINQQRIVRKIILDKK